MGLSHRQRDRQETQAEKVGRKGEEAAANRCRHEEWQPQSAQNHLGSFVKYPGQGHIPRDSTWVGWEKRRKRRTEK